MTRPPRCHAATAGTRSGCSRSSTCSATSTATSSSRCSSRSSATSRLTDAQLGWLGSAYVLVFSLAALPFGVLSDLRSRRAVIAGGVTALERVHLAERARQQLRPALHLPRRSWASGEAAFGPAAAVARRRLLPGPRPRGGAWASSPSGITLGGVLGLRLGGHLEGIYGWRVAFMTVGVPGFMLRGAGRAGCATRPARRRHLIGALVPARLRARRRCRWCGNLWPLLAALASAARGGVLARPTYGADSKVDRRRVRRRGGGRARVQHLALGEADARRHGSRAAVRHAGSAAPSTTSSARAGRCSARRRWSTSSSPAR